MPSSISSSISAQGFHFTYSTCIQVDDWLPVANCSLHLVHVLPPNVYADQYELMQRPGYSSSLRGTSDVELPVGAVDSADSVLTLNINVPEDALDGSVQVEVDVPLHARYGDPAPASRQGYSTIALPPPVGFWACPSYGNSPIPQKLVPYIAPGSFATSDLVQIPHVRSDERAEITIPVGRLDDLSVVDIGTASIMLLMFLYLTFQSVKHARRLHPPPTKTD